MKPDRKMVLLILIFPLLAMLSLTFYRAFRFYVGENIILPIEGYDPRDLLRGHYVTYRVKYGVENLCFNKSSRLRSAGFVCLDNKSFSYNRFPNCRKMIKGLCQAGTFTAGIEKFYIPEAHGKALDKMLRESRGSIELSLTSEGKAQIKQLYIDGIPWSEVVR